MLKQLRHGFGKSISHARIQSHLKKQIPSLELEKVIGRRRADAAWEEKKIIFEIQVSPITLDEVAARIRDYKEMGYQVVWILHVGVFNRRLKSPAEIFLRASEPTYYLNGDLIYDQVGEHRILPVEITQPCTPFLTVPGRIWPLHFVGDAHTLCAREGVEAVPLPLRGWKWWLYFAGFRILEWVSSTQK